MNAAGQKRSLARLVSLGSTANPPCGTAPASLTETVPGGTRYLRPQRKALCLQQSNRSLCCLGAGPSAAAALLENVVHGLVSIIPAVTLPRLPSTFATVDIEPPRKLLEISPRVIQSTFRTETDFAGKWLTIQS
ncbi:hypothetical protein DTO271D3_7902 [Paecilomyces variotii]|nr:hypothetical protein DTO271D3_7902 [Paecilomyces variotii]KAJ9404815.1 hypothetical protein DTO045G8_7498 [Paecilomyces variotii]